MNKLFSKFLSASRPIHSIGIDIGSYAIKISVIKKTAMRYEVVAYKSIEISQDTPEKIDTSSLQATVNMRHY